MATRSVYRILDRLLADGYVTKRGSKGNKNSYYIYPQPLTQCHPCQNVTPDTVSLVPLTQCHPTPDTVSPLHYSKPSVNHQEPSEGKKRRSRSVEKTFSEWIADVRASGEKPISDYLPVWDYCEGIGLPAEFVELAWLKFRDRYSSDANFKAKRYADWRRAFLNAVRLL